MGLNVIEDGRRDQVGTEIAFPQTTAEIGRRDLFMNCLKQMKAGSLVRGKVERGEVVEREAGAADDDPLREFEQSVGFTPARQIDEAVRADKVEEPGLRHLLPQHRERIHGVVGKIVLAGRVEHRCLKALVMGAEQLRHGEAIAKGSGCPVRFQRLATHRGEENGVKLKRIGGSRRDAEVAAVGRVERAAEESYAQRLTLTRLEGKMEDDTGTYRLQGVIVAVGAERIETADADLDEAEIHDR